MRTGKRTLASVISVGIALILSLAGCGGGSGADAENITADFIGTWSLMGFEGEEAFSQEDLDLAKQLGVTVTLTLHEDGVASMDLMGEDVEGTWEAKTSTTGVFVSEEMRANMELQDETLTLSGSDVGAAMIFGRAGSEDALGVEEEDAAVEGAEASSEEAVLTGGGTVIIDDEFVTVEVLGVKTDWADDPGYVLFVLNKTDHELNVKDKWESFTVDGREVNPSLSVALAPGEYLEAFLGFDDEKLGGGISELTNVRGQLTIRNPESSETLAHVDVELPDGSDLMVIED